VVRGLRIYRLSSSVIGIGHLSSVQEVGSDREIEDTSLWIPIQHGGNFETVRNWTMGQLRRSNLGHSCLENWSARLVSIAPVLNTARHWFKSSAEDRLAETQSVSPLLDVGQGYAILL